MSYLIPSDCSVTSIAFAPPGELSRKVVKRSNARVTFKYPSWKMQTSLQCESENERNCMLYLDMSPHVISFRPQPCEIQYVMNGQDHVHYPDFHVETNGGQHLIEVKTLSGLDQHIRDRSDLLTKLLPNHGFQYHLVIAELIDNPVFLSNAWYIKRNGKIQMPMLAREQLRRLFQSMGGIPWRSLQSTSENPYLNQYVCQLILEGLLVVDLTKPITAETLVAWVNYQHAEGEGTWASLISKKVQ
ncbi:TnsA endonuclease N-terminal domain-containing protein [Methylophilus sp. TWE2]|uniref:TnsA endonuclease N-terminal domain-containing protein n=1 Tax=Methylophilus sp. TWE2 TaxID=1662285 RepID=UPI000AA5F5D1|nr:TnsA endonuclease N-terminal domain-containing protein [Methylophilus sp. TWE2]